MRLENIPKQYKVELLPSGRPTIEVMKGMIVIHSNLRPCVVVEVGVPQTANQRKEGLADIVLREIGTVVTFQPLWKNIKTLGEDSTPYTDFKKGTKLTVECDYVIQAYQMTVVEDAKGSRPDGHFLIKAQQRLFDGDEPMSEGAHTEILTLSLDGLLANPKINTTLTSKTGTGKRKRKEKVNDGWSVPDGCTTGSHTNPNPNPKPNPLNPTSFYAYGYIHIK